MKKIQPTILKGTRDFLPEEMARRNYVMGKMRAVFERFGYAPIETPILSPAETILGKYGEEGDRLTYHFQDAGKRDIALPYDLTVPFARYVASNYGKIPMPFKRYQIQRVWRADKPQRGREREFYQCDIDVVGTKSLLVEAEMALIMQTIFLSLGLKNFKIKFNSRKFMNEVLGDLESGRNGPEIMRAIDKMDKIGKDGVIKELRQAGVKNAEKLMTSLSSAKPSDNEELVEFLNYAKKIGVSEKHLDFDPCLARGLDYYTGIIFEVTSDDTSLGSICAGGRYDNLTDMFEVSAPKSSSPELSGMGIAFGFERIMLILEEKGLLKNARQSSKVLVTVFEEDMLDDSLSLYRELSGADMAAEIYLEPAKLEKQLKFANKKDIPYVLVYGPEEKKKKKVILKDMASGKQETLNLKQVMERLG